MKRCFEQIQLLLKDKDENAQEMLACDVTKVCFTFQHTLLQNTIGISALLIRALMSHLQMFVEKGAMLEEYLGMKIDSDGLLHSLPLLVENHTPEVKPCLRS
jgi:hypothetical protein